MGWIKFKSHSGKTLYSNANEIITIEHDNVDGGFGRRDKQTNHRHETKVIGSSDFEPEQFKEAILMANEEERENTAHKVDELYKKHDVTFNERRQKLLASLATLLSELSELSMTQGFEFGVDIEKAALSDAVRKQNVSQ